MSHASGPRWASPERELVPVCRTCTSYGHDIIFSAETKSLVPRSRLCNRAKRRRLDSRAMGIRTSGANVGTERLRARGGRRESTGVIGAEDGRCQRRDLDQIRLTARHRQGITICAEQQRRQQYPVLAVAHCARSFAQQPRRRGTRTSTGYMRHLPGSFARAPSVLRPSSPPSSSSSSLSDSPSCLPRFKCLEISCGPSFCPGSSASFHSATGSLSLDVNRSSSGPSPTLLLRLALALSRFSLSQHRRGTALPGVLAVSAAAGDSFRRSARGAMDDALGWAASRETPSGSFHELHQHQHPVAELIT
ncbi:hypothetical protein BBK36DRAFT_165451 [Trichoderma citrinoviride]|uniref:Uncharacterized protein n=1 Tax=Trichoderma citrinoviride TaxID=58853 RepID=A0A2T4B7I0_9HYPO|nr:hypothetical protein BBK36DRAFT_165451 [Trichoderma citrinoviride]PTB65171.1 hypothetical protein BBK36DRAFT_165451 [Trichoderma citrinoviride]